MLDWLAGLAQDPLAHGHRVPGVPAPLYLGIVPMRPPETVTFLHAEEYHVVKIIKIEPLL